MSLHQLGAVAALISCERLATIGVVSTQTLLSILHAKNPHILLLSDRGLMPCTSLQISGSNYNASLSLQKTPHRRQLEGKQKANRF